MPDCFGLVRYRTSPGIVSFFPSGTGLIECRTVRHSGIYTHEHAHEHAQEHAHEHAHEHALAHAHLPMMCGVNMDLQQGHEA
jgi:hypothetical protein